MPINHTPTPVMQSGESRPGKAGLLSKSKLPIGSQHCGYSWLARCSSGVASDVTSESRDTSTALAFASRTPTALSMTEGEGYRFFCACTTGATMVRRTGTIAPFAGSVAALARVSTSCWMYCTNS